MASILVYIDCEEGRPAAASLRVLGEARRLATRAGATLYATALIPEPAEACSAWIESLGTSGADKVVLVNAARLAGPPIWSTHGDALTAVARHIRPLLAVFANAAAARELAPRLAAHLGGAFLPDARFTRGPQGQVVVARTVIATGRRQRLISDDLGQTVVAILPARGYERARGADDADVIFFEPPDAKPSSIEHLDSRDDPGRALAGARVVVTAGAGVATADNVALCRELADALGGELGATRPACRRGLAAADRVVGVDGHRVAPELYIACAASGSAAHLGGISTDSVIVAVNRDPTAPIFRVASYGIVGEVSDIVPQLIEAARNAPARRAAR